MSDVYDCMESTAMVAELNYINMIGGSNLQMFELSPFRRSGLWCALVVIVEWQPRCMRALIIWFTLMNKIIIDFDLSLLFRQMAPYRVPRKISL